MRTAITIYFFVIVIGFIWLFSVKEKDTHYKIGPGEIYATSSTVYYGESFIYRQGNELRPIHLCDSDLAIKTELKFKKINLHVIIRKNEECSIIDKVELP